MTDQANAISDAASGAVLELVSATAPAGMHEPGFNRSSEFVMVSSLHRHSEQRIGQSELLAPYLGNLTVRCCELREPRRMPRPGSLSPRERNILELIGEGRSNKEIARSLRIAPETVKSHVKNIFVKLGVERRAHAVARAQGLGLFAEHAAA